MYSFIQIRALLMTFWKTDLATVPRIFGLYRTGYDCLDWSATWMGSVLSLSTPDRRVNRRVMELITRLFTHSLQFRWSCHCEILLTSSEFALVIPHITNTYYHEDISYIMNTILLGNFDRNSLGLPYDIIWAWQSLSHQGTRTCR